MAKGKQLKKQIYESYESSSCRYRVLLSSFFCAVEKAAVDPVRCVQLPAGHSYSAVILAPAPMPGQPSAMGSIRSGPSGFDGVSEMPCK